MRPRLSTCLCACLALPPCLAQPPLGYTIKTVAGTGVAGDQGDGGSALEAQLHNPSSLWLDSSGNLFIADQFNSRIRKLSGGTLSTVAGKGTRGFSGDSGPATSAEISFPLGVAVDSAGNIYIADSTNHRVRRVATGGTITTIAGTDLIGFAGDGGEAAAARINFPAGIAVDPAGNLYFSDSQNQRVRKVSSSGVITTYAGIGVPGWGGDGGPATAALINNPSGLAADAAGNLYICDTDNGSIRKVTPDGIITTVAGSGVNGYSGDGGPATAARLNSPKGVAVDAAGLVYIADTLNSRIRVVSLNGVITTVAGNSYIGDAGDDGPATDAILRFPSALAASPDGSVYVADTQNSRIRLLTPVRPAVPPGPPSVSAGGVLTARSYGGEPAAAPGSWIEIYGTNLAGSTREWTAPEFTGRRAPVSLDGTSVAIAGTAAFVSFVSPGQVNAQVPTSLGPGPHPLVITTAAGTAPPVTLTLEAARAGVLAPEQFRVDTRQYALALLPDRRSYALPAAAVQGIPSRPARPGEVVSLFGVGFGQVDPAIPAGEIAPGPARITAALEILFGDVAATVSYAGLVPGAVGLYQFNVVVPEVADSDAVPLRFTLGGVPGRQALFTAVRR
jgi:uncharacterized protein (TIGR03437 family)